MKKSTCKDVSDIHLEWFIKGRFDRHKYLLIFCDPSDNYAEKPLYTSSDKEFYTLHRQLAKDNNWRSVISIYDLALSPLRVYERHVFDTPKDFVDITPTPINLVSKVPSVVSTEESSSPIEESIQRLVEAIERNTTALNRLINKEKDPPTVFEKILDNLVNNENGSE